MAPESGRVIFVAGLVLHFFHPSGATCSDGDATQRWKRHVTQPGLSLPSFLPSRDEQMKPAALLQPDLGVLTLNYWPQGHSHRSVYNTLQLSRTQPVEFPKQISIMDVFVYALGVCLFILVVSFYN